MNEQKLNICKCGHSMTNHIPGCLYCDCQSASKPDPDTISIEMKNLPRCMLGQMIPHTHNVRTGKTYYIPCQEKNINPDCHCVTPGQAFLCSTGHLTECHAGRSCAEANCSHLEGYREEPEFGTYYDSQGNEHQEF